MPPFTRTTSLLLLLLFGLAGCTAGDKRYCYEKGRFAAYLQQNEPQACKIDFRYRNLAKHPQQPVIYVIAYDSCNEIVARDKIVFPELAPGASQNVVRVLSCDNRIAKIHVNDAVNAGRCYGYECSELCEVKGMTLNFVKQ